MSNRPALQTQACLLMTSPSAKQAASDRRHLRLRAFYPSSTSRLHRHRVNPSGAATSPSRIIAGWLSPVTCNPAERGPSRSRQHGLVGITCRSSSTGAVAIRTYSDKFNITTINHGRGGPHLALDARRISSQPTCKQRQRRRQHRVPHLVPYKALTVFNRPDC